ncbi:ferric reductase [Nocardioides flavescens]|uniref:Ferric reductase n=1 Tax=Nocardioides flavescens TaxID=2691959 RepID=A0A6L7F3L6_9ACTN|nr:ferric reductase [Nocardioides flavescens]MXG91818.1 ferric reductase [Nocardioides flavescens]
MTLWFLARAAGFTAVVAASFAVGLGALGSSSPVASRRVLTQLAHRSAAVLTLAFLALHVVLLVTDSHVDLSALGALVPFTAGWQPVALGLGTLAAYGFGVVSLTGALRGRLAASAGAARAWRGVHLSAYVAWVLAMGHGILAGTDTGAGWALALYAVCAAGVGAAVAVRLGALARARRAPLHRTRTRALVGAAR